MFFIALLLLLALVSVKPTDTAPLESQPYYSEMLIRLDSAFQKSSTSHEAILAGWSKQNITPTNPVRIVGYGLQDDFERVHDSLFVRSVIFQQGNSNYAFLAYDLLFIHPNLKNRIEDAIKKETLPINGIYFTATHSHNSFGGWSYSRLFDQILLDGEKSFIIDSLVNKSILAIKTSLKNVASVTMGNACFNFKDFIRNRISRDGKIDPWMNVVKLVHPGIDTAYIASFSAHATCLFSQMDKNILSGDYPGLLSLKKESKTSLFLFAAGGVGSFSPNHGSSNFEATEIYVQKMHRLLEDSVAGIPLHQDSSLLFMELDFPLPEPCFRISDYWQLRPWIFELTIGTAPTKLSYFQLGNTYFLGFPGEISGELYQDELLKTRSKNKQLIVTSFNGNYTGYVVPQAYYYEKTCHEVREMNWFGPNSSVYFQSVVKKVNEKITQ